MRPVVPTPPLKATLARLSDLIAVTVRLLTPFRTLTVYACGSDASPAPDKALGSKAGINVPVLTLNADNVAMSESVCAYARLRSATNGVIVATSASSKAPINADMGIKALLFNSASSLLFRFRFVSIISLMSQKSVCHSYIENANTARLTTSRLYFERFLAKF